MPYIGNTVQTQGFAPAIDYFNGNGVTVTFTLSRPVASVAQLIVAIDNVIQNPSSSFTVAGNAITFTSAPLSGTNNIWVEYTSLITTYQGISQDPTVIGDIRATGGYLAEGDFGNSFVDGNLIDYVTGRGRLTVGELDDITFYHGGTSARSPMMDLYYAGGAKIYGTTALTLPVGTTGERPTGANGMIRYNTTLNALEGYIGGNWTIVKDNTYSIEYLIIAGGAGGGIYAGGGGAGGYITNNGGTALSVTPGTAYAFVIGAGGAGRTTLSAGAGDDGVNTTAFGLTAIGGGASGSSSTGNSGGSGGGGGYDGAGGAGTVGQGNNGGAGANNSGAVVYLGGGGGGAGAVGIAATLSGYQAGGGGAGKNTEAVWASATSTGVAGYYAGGGGAGVPVNGPYASGQVPGAGGAGGGTAGTNGTSAPSNATANTGSGGGSAGYNQPAGYTYYGANGGSGIVIVRYAGAQRGTGGTVVTTGGYTYHTFTSSGTFTA